MENNNLCCCPSWRSSKIFKILIILFALVLLAVLIWIGVIIVSKIKSYPYLNTPYEERNTIAISGEGSVVAIPDVALISLGVVTEKTTVIEAQKENTDKMNKITDKIKSFAVEGKDIKTASYRISPRYDWQEGTRVFRGYEIEQMLSVKIRDINKVGVILSAATEMGANQAGDLVFTIDDPEIVKQEARIKALENAKTKAQALAKAAGVKLGKVVSFSESSEVPSYFYRSYALAEGMGGGGETAPNIEAGSTEVKVNVTVSYVIK